MAERTLVTGATGELGRELVGLLARSRAVVRAATRSPAAARALFPPNVEVVELDFDRTETYDAAAERVDRIFLMPPPFDPDAYGTINPFLDWAVGADLQQVVLVSAMDAESLPDLALRKVERHLEKLGIGYTILRPNLYMQNLSSGFLAESIRTRDEFELCAGDGRVSFVDVRDVAAVAAEVLSHDRHYGHAYTLTGSDVLSFGDVARTLSAVTGRKIGYRAIGAEQMRGVLTEMRWPARQAAVGVGLFQAVADGRRQAVRDDVHQVLGRDPIRFENFVHEHAAAWRPVETSAS